MKTQLTRIIAALVALCLSTGAAFAQVETIAPYALIMDFDTGSVLYEKKADEPIGPSSMSKLMTVAIVFEKLKAGELKLTDEFSVSEKAWREREGSTMWVRVNTKIPLYDLLQGIIVQSGNDACIVVAENISGSEEAFAQLMNKKAREWGLKNSTFANSTGLPDPHQLMSVRDLGLLARKIIRDYPEYYKYFGEKEFTWEKIRQSNRNPLLFNFKGADGLKTGHTQDNGYGLVGSAKQDGKRRIIVVNGLPSNRDRTSESARLMRIAFNDFTTKTLYEKGEIAGDAQVFAGNAKTVPLITGAVISMILPRLGADDIKAKVIYEGPVPAPIAEGQQIGALRVETRTGDTREFPLYAGKDVAPTGVIGRIGMALKALIGTTPEPEAGGGAPAARQ